ncbi:MAG: hypothetical protein JXR94_05815 [Candidatus Hydrogenedentes bacterium]|nr:hypothetical protein [Candidatus Hydrogenedentota bacterium]
MKARHRLVAVPVVLALGFGVVVSTQRHLDAIRIEQSGEELLYLPNEKLLNHFTGGMSGVVADVLWLKCIQYTSKHFRGDRKFEWLNHMCQTITRLDPYFGDVYRYGGVFLAALKADDDASLALLRSGVPDNPDRWELPYEMAVIYLLNRRDQPGSAEQAARFLAMAAATGTAPAAVVQFANDLQRKYDLAEVERAMWLEMAENSDDEIMRDMARRKLQELTLRENCARLNEAMAQFGERFGHAPESVDELVSAGLVTALPPDPLGGRYFIDADGAVKNTTILDQAVERRLNLLRAGLDRFHEAEGRWPATLQAIYDKGHLSFVPPHPYAGRDWRYDPQTGAVEG